MGGGHGKMNRFWDAITMATVGLGGGYMEAPCILLFIFLYVWSFSQ